MKGAGRAAGPACRRPAGTAARRPRAASSVPGAGPGRRASASRCPRPPVRASACSRPARPPACRPGRRPARGGRGAAQQRPDTGQDGGGDDEAGGAAQRGPAERGQDGTRDPERDPHQDVEQAQGDQGLSQGAAHVAGQPAGGEEHLHGGGHDQPLGDLDGKGRGERPPPPAGRPGGLRQGVEGEQDRGGGGQQDHRHQPDDVDRREHQGQDDTGQGQQDQEDPAVGDRVAQRGHQRGRGALRVHASGGEGGGQAVGKVDGAGHQDHRQVRADEAEHDPGGDLLGRVGGLQGLVAHHDDPADEDQQPVAGVGDPEPGRPQGPHRRDGVRLRG